MQLDRLLIQTLENWQRAGLSEIGRVKQATGLFEQLAAEADDSVTAKTQSVAPSPAETTQSAQTATPRQASERTPPATPTPSRPTPAAKPMVAEDQSRPLQPDLDQAPMSREERIHHLSVLAERVAKCERCPELVRNRTQTVFGVGDPEAEVMFIGEAPGADEDRQGEPFVGRAGQLLDKIIAACGWKREEVYICNILRCRPPGNRNPSPIEAENCREYLLGQIETIRPRYIVCWGSVAAQQILQNKTPIGRMRGRLYEFAGARVLCTYHPSYLLRNPAAKKLVWEDLKVLLREMGIDPDGK